jgi:hypothetical protein
MGKNPFLYIDNEFLQKNYLCKEMKRNQLNGKLLSPLIVLMVCALYLLFSVGIIKATHFCMGREASVAYFTSESKKCVCSLFLDEKDNCCDDTSELLKLEDSQKNLSAFELPLPMLALLGQIYSNAQGSVVKTSDHRRAIRGEAKPPPRILYKIHCSLVFYDKKSIA